MRQTESEGHDDDHDDIILLFVSIQQAATTSQVNLTTPTRHMCDPGQTPCTRERQ